MCVRVSTPSKQSFKRAKKRECDYLYSSTIRMFLIVKALLTQLLSLGHRLGILIFLSVIIFFAIFFTCHSEPTVGVADRHFFPGEPSVGVARGIFPSEPTVGVARGIVHWNILKFQLPLSEFLLLIKFNKYLQRLSGKQKSNLLLLLTTFFCIFLCNMSCNSVPIKVTQGSFSQADPRFGYSAGMQCSCNAAFAICFSKFKSVNCWNTTDIDYVLNEGDKNFKRHGYAEMPFIDQFPKNILLEQQELKLEYLCYDAEFVSNDIVINFVTDDLLFHHDGSIILINGYSIAVIFHARHFFLFDSHSRDALGCVSPNGTSVLMKFNTLKGIKDYVRATYTSTNLFQIMYVKTVIENFVEKDKIIKIELIKRHKKVRQSKYKICESTKCSKRKAYAEMDEEKLLKIKEKKKESQKRAYAAMQKCSEKHEKIKENKKESQKRTYAAMQKGSNVFCFVFTHSDLI